MRSLRLLLVVAAAIPLVGCNPITGACTTEARPGIVVEVRDAVTSANAAAGARLTVRAGEYVETVDGGVPMPDYPFIQAAYERAGVYSVTVQKAGYEEWTRAPVLVRDGGCHVRTVELVARLQPLQQ